MSRLALLFVAAVALVGAASARRHYGMPARPTPMPHPHHHNRHAKVRLDFERNCTATVAFRRNHAEKIVLKSHPGAGWYKWRGAPPYNCPITVQMGECREARLRCGGRHWRGRRRGRRHRGFFHVPSRGWRYCNSNYLSIRGQRCEIME